MSDPQIHRSIIIYSQVANNMVIRRGQHVYNNSDLDMCFAYRSQHLSQTLDVHIVFSDNQFRNSMSESYENRAGIVNKTKPKQSTFYIN